MPAGPVQARDRRTTWPALDRLTGRSVFVKTGPRADVLRPLSVLLQLPGGVAPGVEDVFTSAPGELALVEERLAGSTLLEAAGHLDPRSLPALLVSLCRALAGMHRAGFVHADLKPGNIFLLDEPANEVRLLDPEFAWSLGPSGVDEGELRGGTPGYAAPELLRGWSVDPRADLFSLGMTLEDICPGLRTDPSWAEIVDRLTQPRASQRYADVLELRRTVEERFGLPVAASAPPVFGAGPLRGRASQIAAVLEQLRTGPPASLLLIQARPGVGLSRFLLECGMAAARAGQEGIRILDHDRVLSALPPDGSDRSVLYIEEWLARGETVLLGVADPSPSLRAIGSRVSDPLRDLVGRLRPWRLLLPPVDAEAMGEILGSSLGAVSPPVAQLARRLRRRTSGDLRLAAQGSAHVLAASATEDGLIWQLRRDAIDGALAEWHPDPPPPSWDELPSSLRRPLGLLARIGPAFPEDFARRMLERFSRPEILSGLVDPGLLLDSPGGGLRFLHESLWDAAREETLADSPEVEAWLNREWTPGAQDVPRVIEAALRARRLEDTERESSSLRAAFEKAAAEDRWDDLRLLLSYPEEARVWSAENAGSAAGELHLLLGEDWPAGRILLLAGQTLVSFGDTSGLDLLALGAEDPSASIRARCLLLLARYTRSPRRMQEYEKHISRLKEMVAAGAEIAGEVDLELGRLALARGDRAAAEALGMGAVQKLQGSGTAAETDSLMFAAVLLMPHRAEEAIAHLEKGLSATTVPTSRAMIRQLMSQIYEVRGELPAFEAAAQAALDTLGADAPHSYVVPIRSQRAWARIMLDRVPEATAEASELLQYIALRRDKSRIAFLLLLQGFAALHEGNAHSAITRLSSAWEDGQQYLEAGSRAVILRYLLDALLDLEAWEVVREYGAALALQEGSGEPKVELTARRARALLLQADGRLQEAQDLLAPSREEAAGQADRLDATRFLHHLGVVRVRLARQCVEERKDPAHPDARMWAEQAREDFRLALDRFGRIGYGYFRARSLLELSRAEELCGERDQAMQTLNRAIELARSIDSRGILAAALRARAELRLAGS